MLSVRKPSCALTTSLVGKDTFSFVEDQKLFQAVIEDPNGTSVHMEFNEQTGKYEIAHVFQVPWPFHYGYLQGTRVDSDNDPLDVAIFGNFTSETGQNILVRIIGAAIIQDGDHKVFAVNPDDRQFGSCTEYRDIPVELRERGEHVFARGGHVIEDRLSSLASAAFVRKHLKKK